MDSERETGRRRFIGSAVAGLAGVTGLGGGLPEAAAGQTEGRAAGVGELWRFDRYGAPDASIEPVVRDGLVYGIGDGVVYAATAEDGTERWATDTIGEVRRPPVVRDGTVYVVSEGLALQAFDAETGAVRWTVAIGERTRTTVADGGVYLSDRTTVTAVDPGDGDVRWRADLSQEYGLSAPAVAGGRVYVISDDEEVIHAFDSASGDERWQREVGQAPSALVAAAGTVYVGNENGVAALAAADGSRRWRHETLNRTEGLELAGDALYHWTDFGFEALDPGDGGVRWRWDGDVESAPVARGGTVYVAGFDTLYALDAGDGGERWHREFRYVDSGPIVADGRVYVEDSGGLYALDTDGDLRWYFGGGRFDRSSRPTVDDRRLYLTVGGTGIVAIGGDGPRLNAAGRGQLPRLLGGVSPTWLVGGVGGVAVGGAVLRTFGEFGVGTTVGNALGASPDDDWQGVLEKTALIGAWIAASLAYLALALEYRAAIQVTLPAYLATGPARWLSVVALVGAGVAAVAGTRVLADAFDYDLGPFPESAVVPGGLAVLGALLLPHVSGLLPSGSVWFVTFGVATLVWLGATGAFLVYWRNRRYSPPSYGVFLLSVMAVAYVPLQAWLFVGGGASLTAYYRAATVAAFGHAVALGFCGLVLGRRFLAACFPRDDGLPLPTTLGQWRGGAGDPGNAAAVPDATLDVSPSGADAWTTVDGVATPPAVAGPVVVAGTDDGAVRATDATTGERRWTAAVGEGAATAPAVGDGVVYAAAGTTLAALDRVEGTERWTATLDAPPAGAPANDSGRLFLALADGTVECRDAADGERRWATAYSSTIARPPAVGVGTVYVAREDGVVVALDADDGTEQWATDLAVTRPTAPTRVGDTVYVADGDGYLHALSAADGDHRWRLETGTDPLARLAATKEAVFVAGSGGRVAAVGPDGSGLGVHETDTLVAPPVVVGETLYLPTGRALRALDARSGETDWSLPTDGVATGLAPTTGALYLGTDAGLRAFPAGETVEQWGARVADDEPAAGDEAVETAAPDTPAGRFAGGCDAVTAVESVDESGPIHVYGGRLADEDRRVAVLVLAPGADDAAAAFTRAVERWAGISHNPHVVTVYDSGRTPRPWAAVETGDPLSETDDVAAPLAVLDGVVEGLNTAGLYNVSHGTVAPETVVLDDSADETVAMLRDWGLSRAVAGEPPVTPYTAPEQLDGGTAATTDVYRTALVAYRLLTGRDPFAGADDLEAAIRDGSLVAPSTAADVPEAVDRVVGRATATEPGERYDSPTDFRDALRAALD
ncbi:PQQ-binding-like beta-propeller repeat protein [Haloarcula litorea]|uniref:outer membrane protein assembly factor BamB family protein n=1 Tax=Haloarcula litorea TaxID=3032579 RepID=UPI0023E849D3|nr:PQQ-binding-like beta-propeller repeat protein [Halomicroarcula sp. GDY20]